MATLRAARMEKKIVKIPKNETVVTLGRSEPTIAGSFWFEQDLAINQQCEKLDRRKSVVPAEPLDLLRCRKHGQGARNFRIADFEQRTGAGRFQDRIVAAPSHIGEPRQDESVGFAERLHPRPIIWNLRFNNNQVLAVSRRHEVVFDESIPGQSPDEELSLLVDFPVVSRKQAQRQARTQLLHTIRSSRAELAHTDRLAIDAGDDLSTRMRFDGHARPDLGGKRCRPDTSRSL